MSDLKLFWKRCSELQLELSEGEKKWLFNQDSLTERLVRLSQHNFTLKLLSERKERIRNDECEALCLDWFAVERVREVVLQGNGQDWVYARSIIKSDDSKTYDVGLYRLNDQPLGSILFQNNLFKRSEIEVIRYPRRLLSKYYDYSNLWARRSVFHHEGHAVLVQEIFLPDFWKKIIQ